MSATVPRRISTAITRTNLAQFFTCFIIRQLTSRLASSVRRPSEPKLSSCYPDVGVARPTFFGVVIIFLVYVPILTLTGVEGKMFDPMAMTVLFAVAASLVVALTLMPVLGWYAFRHQVKETTTWLIRRVGSVYDPVLGAALRFPKAIAAAVALLFVGSLGIIPFLGAEFLPRLDEGSILVMMYRVPGISISESLHGNEIIETVLKQFPEVDKVVCRTGRPEVAVDPMAIDQSDVYVMLKPVSDWRSKGELVTAMKEALEKEAPGAAYSFMQPIEMRMQELMEAGVRSDIAVKIYGEDLDVLRERAQQIVKVVEKVPGAADVRAERVSGLPYLPVAWNTQMYAAEGLRTTRQVRVWARGGGTCGRRLGAEISRDGKWRDG